MAGVTPLSFSFGAGVFTSPFNQFPSSNLLFAYEFGDGSYIDTQGLIIPSGQDIEFTIVGARAWDTSSNTTFIDSESSTDRCSIRLDTAGNFDLVNCTAEINGMTVADGTPAPPVGVPLNFKVTPTINTNMRWMGCNFLNGTSSNFLIYNAKTGGDFILPVDDNQATLRNLGSGVDAQIINHNPAKWSKVERSAITAGVDPMADWVANGFPTPNSVSISTTIETQELSISGPVMIGEGVSSFIIRVLSGNITVNGYPLISSTNQVFQPVEVSGDGVILLEIIN